MIRNKIVSLILVGAFAFTGVNVYGDSRDGIVSVPTVTLNNAQKGPLDPIQLNSITMLNYMTYLTQSINSSNNSRIYLDEAYSSLINNTDPSKIDVTTQSYLNSLLDTLESYRMLSVKRERLQYIYERNQAMAIRSAIPNPIGLLSAVSSGNAFRAIASAIYMTVDSATSYTSAMNEVELEYLQEGWQLDDEESNTIHNSRVQLFNYMISIVRDYSIPGDYALNENAVTNFVSSQNNSNITSRLQFLEDNESVYRYFGPYWLALAECYYLNEDYEACLDAFDNYSSCTTDIFRKDYELANALPMAITSAKYVMTQDEFDEIASAYADMIIANTDASDWALRYFAAQTYMTLYHDTGEEEYLQDAYNTIATNVNELIQTQLEYNEAYVEEYEEMDVPAGATEQIEQDIEDYNDYMDELRSVELPPLYSPLALNCELLWALADELDVSDAERNRIDQLLHGYDTPCFLNESVDNYYTFGETDSSASDTEIELSEGEVVIPATLLSENSSITLLLIEGNRQIRITSWSLKKVKRNTEGDISTYNATFVSDSADDHEYVDGSRAILIISTPVGTNTTVEERFYFNIDVSTYVWLFDDAEFTQTWD